MRRQGQVRAHDARSKGSRHKWQAGSPGAGCSAQSWASIVVAGAAGGIAVRVVNKAAAEGRRWPASDARVHVCRHRAHRAARADALAARIRHAAAGQPDHRESQGVRRNSPGARYAKANRSGQGRCSSGFDTADLEAKLTDRIGALESSRAQLALAEKTRTQNQALLKQNFISQNAYDSAESNLSVTQGYAQIQRGAGAARAQRLARRGGDRAAVRDAGQAPRPAGREGELRLTAIHHRRSGGAWSCRRWCRPTTFPRSAIAHAGRAFDRRLRRRGASRARSSASTRRPRRARARFWCSCRSRIRTRRCAAACSPPGASRSPQARPCRRCPRLRSAPRPGRPSCGRSRPVSLARRSVTLGRRDEAAALGRAQERAAGGCPVLAARFDNLKEGGPGDRCARLPRPSPRADRHSTCNRPAAGFKRAPHVDHPRIDQ